MPEKLTKVQKKVVEQEIKKRLHRRIYERTKSSALKFKKEMKKHTATAITAAFAFLIALSWRTPIKNSVDNIINKMGLGGKALFIEYLSAIAITILAVLALILISRWTAESA